MEWYRPLYFAFFFLYSLVCIAELPPPVNTADVLLPAMPKLTLNKNFPPLVPATSELMPDPSEALMPPAQTAVQALSNAASANVAGLTGAAPTQVTNPLPAAAVPAVEVVLPAAAEAAVILSNNRFYPSKIQMPAGTKVRIWFTTVESKPAALIVEGLKMQRWIAAENASLTPSTAPDYFELQRELTRERVTEITLEPSAGTYPFFDALSGARGEIVVQ
jgi:hypothetical protein